MSREKNKLISFKWKDVCKLEPPFAGNTFAMMNSAAWQAMSGNCRKFYDFLELENMRQDGYRNGKLTATYDDLVKFGMRRASISKAINEAIELGWVIKTVQGVYRGHPSYTQYRLTARPYQIGKECFPASNEWKLYQPPQQEKALETALVKNES